MEILRARHRMFYIQKDYKQRAHLPIHPSLTTIVQTTISIKRNRARNMRNT